MVIKLFGSSHISGNFANRIYDKILVEEPSIVAVELDRERAKALFSNKKEKISLKLVKSLGLFGFLFAFLGSKVQKYLGKKIGFEPGIDMKKAIIAAKKIHAKILLIDQPLPHTIKKISKIRFKEKIKLFFYLIWPFPSKKMQFNLKEVPSEKTINLILNDFKNKFPQIYSVLVEERNKYIAKNLINIEKKYRNSEIFAVLGAGHVSEVEKIMKKYRNLS